MNQKSYLIMWENLKTSKDPSKALFEHFQVLARTAECQQILEDIMKKTLKVDIENGKLKIDFEEGYLLCEPPCAQEISGLPHSYQDILRLHNGITFFIDEEPQIIIKGRKDEVPKEDNDETLASEFDENTYYETDDEIAKEAPLVSFHDYYVFNDRELTTFGELSLSFYDPEMGYMDKPISLDLSVGGYFLRQIGYEILDGDKRCEKFVEYVP